jgi:hypothetical protein
MRMPGLNAVASLYRPIRSYGMRSAGVGPVTFSSVMPQLRPLGGGFGVITQCQNPTPDVCCDSTGACTCCKSTGGGTGTSTGIFSF